jgi:microcystin-dependent protein
MSSPFLGEIRMVSFNFAPTGWLLCQGQILSIQQNSALFAVLGTTYGGNGTSTFQLPNLQGRVPISMGQSLGTSNYLIGHQGGVESVALSVSQMPLHSHLLNAVGSGGNQASPVGNFPAIESTGTSLNYSGSPATGPMAGAVVSSVGGSAPVPVIQPYLCVNFIIATAGVYP